MWNCGLNSIPVFIFTWLMFKMAYRNYPMFSDTLCFRTPPYFFTEIIIFLTSENIHFGHTMFSDTLCFRTPYVSDPLCFRTPTIFHWNNYFFNVRKNVFRTPYVFGHPMFLDTLCFWAPYVFGHLLFFTEIIFFLTSENMYFRHPLFSDTPYFSPK